MRTAHLIVLPALLALLLAACGKDKTPEEQRQDAMAELRETTKRVNNLPANQAEAAAELQAISKDLEDRLAKANAGDGKQAIDACAFLDAAQAEALIGAPATSEAMSRMGSSWGGCNYSPAEVNLETMNKQRYLMVNIRPATEFDATVDHHRSKGPVSEAPGLDGKAYVDGKSLLWQPPGKPWFVFVSGGPLGKQDPGFAVAAAQQMTL